MPDQNTSGRTESRRPVPDREAHDLAAEAVWDSLVRTATTWPATRLTRSYHTPSLSVGSRRFARLRTEADFAVVLVSTPPERRAWIESGEPGLFAEPHYEASGHLLADPARVRPEVLEDLLDAAWAMSATDAMRQRRATEAQES